MSRVNLLKRVSLIAVAGLVSASAGLTVFTLAGPTYTAQTTLALLPGETSYPEGDNPLLFTSSLVQARDVVVNSASSADALKSVTRSVPTAQVSITIGVPSTTPLISVAATAPTPGAAVSAMREAVGATVATAKRVQAEAGVPSRSQVTVFAISRSAAIDTSYRLPIAFGGLTTLLVAAALLGGLYLVRRRRLHRRRSAE